MSGERGGPPGVRERAAAYLRECHVMTLATHGREGPWAAAVFYASNALTLHFLSSPSTRHAQDVAADSRVCVTVQKDCADWRDIRGVQLAGVASEVGAADLARVQSLYAAKFPIVAPGAGAPEAIVRALARVCWYTIVPERAYFVDNSRGFGVRDEIDL